MSSDIYHPPVAPRHQSRREIHGDPVEDDYAWMRQTDAPELREYLEAERAYYDASTRELLAFAQTLFEEAQSRLPAGDDESVAWPLHSYVYRTRLPADAENEQLLRSREGEPREQLLLDENLLAAKTGFVELGAREPSPDGDLLAWSVDLSGAELYQLRIRDLRTGEDLPDVIDGTFPDVAWSATSEYLFYVMPDEARRPFQVWRHRLGTPASEDQMVFEENDQKFDLMLEGSRSGDVAIITSASRDTTEVWLLRLERPLDDPVMVAPRERGVDYQVDHARASGAGTLYVVTNVLAEEFALMRAPAGSPGRANWTEVSCASIAPARSDTRLERCVVLAEHLVLTVRRGGGQLLVIADHDGGGVREIPPSLDAGSIRVEHAEDYERDSVIVAEESLIAPTAWFRLELATGERTLLKQMEVPDYEQSRYRTERRLAPAPDGTPIPVTLAYRDDVRLDGSAPCLLYGYGSYEVSLDPDFDRSLPSLLDRGMVFAVAHIRGGGEGGRSWWQQGRLRRKRTTFTDFLAIADWLAASGVVDGSRIVSRGRSAGGLLQGAVYSMRPDRWRAAIAEVPFVDVVNTMLDPTLPLTANEWDEWGDPRERDDYEVMRSYSPYENPPTGARPALLVTGAVHDPRVSIHEPAKWVARLRATDADGSRLLFRPELGVGSHSGPSGRRARLRYEADVQAFILDAVGIGL